MLALYAIGYGTVRFFIEFFREPDAHLGFIFLFFSMGQLLCMAMIIAGIGLFFLLKRAE
jgi:phosphatidylglycerol:prolipoprotein diacylglycerol transferase